MRHQVKIKIADIVFRIDSNYEKPVEWLKKNYRPFLSGQRRDFLILLEYSEKRKRKKGRYLAKWSKGRGSFKTEFFDADLDFISGEIFVTAGYGLGIVDLVKFLFSMILIKNGGFLLHACAVQKNNLSYVFFGPSESGKTTIARLSKGKIILSDETAAIVKKRNKYYAYATPFFGEFGQVKQNTGAPVKAIFYIKKDVSFKHYKIKSVNAAKEMLCHAMINILDHRISDLLLDNLKALSGKTPCYELHFKKEPKIWEYIDGSVE